MKKGTASISLMVLKIKDATNNSIFRILLQNEYIYILYAVQGYSNKEVAKIIGKSEITVSRKYSALYEELDVSGKKELVNLYLTSTGSSLYKKFL